MVLAASLPLRGGSRRFWTGSVCRLQTSLHVGEVCPATSRRRGLPLAAALKAGPPLPVADLAISAGAAGAGSTTAYGCPKQVYGCQKQDDALT